jgi:tetratricopeptide (TPR) repeat protein
MKTNFVLAGVCALALLSAAPAGGQVPALVDFDAALAGAVAEIASKSQAQGKTAIAIVQLAAPSAEISGFIADELSALLVKSGKFTVLTRGSALDAVTAEHNLQMSGIVSDKDIVGVGHYLGAKVVVAGTFSRYAEFCQLRLRAIDVRSSEIVVQYSARILTGDPVLAGVLGEKKGGAKPPAVTEDALAYFNRGGDFLRAGMYDEAISQFNQALAINKNLIDGYFYRGYAYYHKGDYGRAIADYTATLRVKPDPHALNNRGLAYDDKGDYDHAIADYTTALRIKPDYHEALFSRGYAYANKGDYDRAIADYTAALRIKPDPHALNNRGYAYDEKGDYDRAIADYTAALRIKPDHLNALYNRGNAYANKGNYDRAIADYTAAIKIKPDYHEALYNRGNAYDEKGNYDRAIADHTAALRIKPDKSEALYNRGNAYYHKGDYNRAIADYTAVLQIDPSDDDAKRALEETRKKRGY